MSKKCLVVMSGGMDSTLCTYIMKEKGYEIIALHFNYKQRTQTKELECFHALCTSLEVQNKYVIDLDFFEQIGASALTDKSIEVPTSGLGEGVPITYVPFRNGIFLSIAGAIAEKEHLNDICLGVVEEDSSGYPDCRASFINAFKDAINLGTKDETSLVFHTPLITLKKSQIVQKALQLNARLELTWSCYKNEDKACGKCDSCLLRLRGLKEANYSDPIQYE